MMDMVKDKLKRGRQDMMRLLLAFPLALGMGWAGSGKAGTVTTDPALQAAGTQASAPAAKPASKKAAKPSRAKRTVAKKAATTPGGVATPKTPPIQGRRDPFKLPGPPVAAGEGEIALGPLPPGTRGLVIGRLRLEGIVRLDTTSTMIAVVDTSANRAYFLRENDAVYNGVVSKITPDTVTFRENALDPNGKVYARDVILRLGQGPGA
jgi:hypothetical protein